MCSVLKVCALHQAPARTPRLLLGVSGGTILAPSPASGPAATHQLKPAPPSHSETFKLSSNMCCFFFVFIQSEQWKYKGMYAVKLGRVKRAHLYVEKITKFQTPF